MIELKKCCSVPFPERLFAQFELCETSVVANVNASQAVDVIRRFIDGHSDEPLFFILENPSKAENESLYGKSVSGYLPDDVYYIDGLYKENALQVLDSLGEFLVKDGMNTFGFGGHHSHEEILFGRYNVMTVYTKEPERYKEFFEAFGLEETENLVTAWKTFDLEHGGECCLYESDGKTIYDIPEAFKDYGMYFYERRGGNPLSFDDLKGKVLLAGFTYYNEENEIVKKDQRWGTVVEAEESIITIRQKNGEVFTLPPDLSSIQKACKGEYKLESTGEIVVDPDLTSRWSIVHPDN